MADPRAIDLGSDYPTEPNRYALIEAARAAERLKPRPYPGRLSQIINHPGAILMGQELDSPGEYENDQRRAELLRRLSEYSQSNEIEPIQEYGSQLGNDILRYRRGEVDETPYHETGYLSGRSPLGRTMSWWGSFPATAYHGSQSLANAITPNMYPGAEKNLQKSLNTLTVYGAEDYGLVPRNTGTAMDVDESARETRGMVPWHASVDEAAERMADIDAASGAMKDRFLPTGYDHLTKSGIPAKYAQYWGPVMDMVLDPSPAIVDAWKLSKAGNPMRAIKAMATEAAPMLGPTAAIEGYTAYDKLLDRLHGVQLEYAR